MCEYQLTDLSTSFVAVHMYLCVDCQYVIQGSVELSKARLPHTLSTLYAAGMELVECQVRATLKSYFIFWNRSKCFETGRNCASLSWCLRFLMEFSTFSANCFRFWDSLFYFRSFWFSEKDLRRRFRSCAIIWSSLINIIFSLECVLNVSQLDAQRDLCVQIMSYPSFKLLIIS